MADIEKEGLIELNDAELKTALLEVLLKIDAWCTAHDVDYFLWGGTLLGAVRHHGFIPWDDDVDIAMPRKDYERFLAEFSDDRLEAVSCENHPRYPFPFAKVVDRMTVKDEVMQKHYAYDDGVDVDIFPIDDYTDREAVEAKVPARARLIRKHWLGHLVYKPVTGPRVLARNLLVFAGRVLGFDSHRLSVKMNRDAMEQTDGNGTPMLYADSNLPKHPLWMEKSWIASYVRIPFEGYELSAPVDYDALLTAIYGDYMTPPPPEKQVTHHDFKVYRKGTEA